MSDFFTFTWVTSFLCRWGLPLSLLERIISLLHLKLRLFFLFLLFQPFHLFLRIVDPRMLPYDGLIRQDAHRL